MTVEIINDIPTPPTLEPSLKTKPHKVLPYNPDTFLMP